MVTIKNQSMHFFLRREIANGRSEQTTSFLLFKSFVFISIIFLITSGFAQTPEINPTPQTIKTTGELAVPKKFIIKQKNTDVATEKLLAKFFTAANTSSNGFLITVGDVNSKFSRSIKAKVPKKPEAYYLSISKKEITVIGSDARGAYYGVQTLLALLHSDKIVLTEIIDFPDVAARGVVEGFYGTPWSFENRLRQLDFYGSNKLNTYIYGPKDDPYHSSPNWRKPYPKEETTQLKKLIDRAEMNHVDFVWAIHPGQDIKWNDEDRKALLNKFGLMYDLGVRAFAVFFDDISGEGTDAKQQAQLLNFINSNFVQIKKDVKPLIMCPTEYNKGWSDPKSNYLETLGSELDPSIHIMWTGNSVIADIDLETLEWINTKIQRKAFIWWNFPVSDYVRNHLLLGPTYGNGLDIAPEVSGFVSNPMEHAEASKIAIYGVADYSWNMAHYQPGKKWTSAIKVVMPESFKALEIFAGHNSDLGPNGHLYRRTESVNFKKEADLFLENLKSNAKVENLDSIRSEFQKMVDASFVLLNSTDNPELMDEIGPWVKQFKLQGQSGLTMLEMFKALHERNTENFELSYQAFKAIQVQMYAIDQNENQNPYQPGVKTATLVVTPLIDSAFTYLTKAYNKDFHKNLSAEVNYNPHTLFTSIPQLMNQQISLSGRTLKLNPPLEVIKVSPDAYFGFKLQETGKIKRIEYQITPIAVNKQLKIEVSTDGLTWIAVNTEEKKETVQATFDKLIKYVRVRNGSAEDLKFKIQQFKIEL